MNLFILVLSHLIWSITAAIYTPDVKYLKNDASELNKPLKDYLPPQVIENILPKQINDELLSAAPSDTDKATVEATPLSQLLQEIDLQANEGYEYKIPIVRVRRDVSHLKFDYLPPIGVQQKVYLPPRASEEAIVLKPNTAYLPPLKEKDILALQASKDYLPPLSQEQTENYYSSDIAESVNSDFLPTVRPELEPTEVDDSVKESLKTENDYSDGATENEAIKSLTNKETSTMGEVVEEGEQEHEAVKESSIAGPIEESAILTSDGYHYKAPNAIPDELFNSEPIAAEMQVDEALSYLPPSSQDVVEIAAPEESAIYSKADGYRYRAIRRRY